MFLGHFAVALASKRLAPRRSLGLLTLAAQLPDVLWPVFLLMGIEQVRIAPGDTAFTPLDFVHYPWSHSLLMTLAWGALLGVFVYVRSHDRRSSVIVGLLPASHWVLDVIAHRPDLPLVPASAARYGLGLWNHPVATFVIESVMFVIGIAIYLRATRARDGIGRWAAWSYLVALAALHVLNANSGPPPSVTAIAIVALVGVVLFGAWAWWLDDHREPRVSTTSASRA
jgi:hypothetical protein